MFYKPKQLIIKSIWVLLLVFEIACSKHRAVVKSSNFADYIKATVIEWKVDGCDWMLELDEPNKIQPINLSNDFKKDGLKVWIKYSVEKGAVSTCMAGQIVKLVDIQKRIE
jgi:hypothetical protein